jgi:3-methyladenine DNA glycosylase/8-oxoguanine DNA glycosylase
VTEASERIVLEPPFAIDVGLTLGPFRCGAYDPTFAREGAVVWRAVHTPDGPATVRVAPTGDQRSVQAIQITAWGSGRSAALASMPAMLGFHDDDRDFVAHHEVVRRAHRRFPGARIGSGGALVETLVATVLEQKVTSDEAHRSWSALVRRYGEPAPGPSRLTLAPLPELLAELRYPAWHPLGVERRRADTIRRLCSRATRLRALERETPTEARRVLEHFPGVGPWTSATATLRAMGDRDAVVVGDYHYPHIVSYSLTGERRGTDEQMLELLAPYCGHRARAMRLLLLGGSHPPRRAPRARRRSFARM